MICPHCEKSLLRKERPGNVCGKCGRRYALDPKTNAMGLNDLRVRRIVLRLTQDGQVPCTSGQLWYALSRTSLRNTRVEMGCAVVLAIAGVVAGLVGLGQGSVAFGAVGGVALLAAGCFVVAKVKGVGRGRPRLTRDAFRTGPLEEWKKVYGTLPAGVVDDSRYPRPPTPADGVVLVCPDRSVAVFLDAAGLTARHGVTLTAVPAAPPGRGPVLVLHDADADGLLLPHRVRTALPGRRVVDIGLPLGAVHGRDRAVPVRGDRPGADVMKALETTGEFSGEQLTWLARGWGFPLVGIPPARLLAAVSRAVEGAGTQAAPQRRRAAALGFMTWPEEGP
ncbi:hypothetical protein ABZZ36_33555 [Actinacidiphila glaucinigra]|uniref:hypothetical protein n=1 Tax=Actinacidiphila glaucinigra TaxID=235986 RepID=UPI0033A6A1DC